MKVATATTASFTNMLPPMEREISSAARASSGGPRLGNPEGAAIDRRDVEDFAGLAGRAARIPDPRRHQRRDTEHEQVKRAAHQLGDDEDEAGDQPGKGNVHGTKTG